MKRPLKKLATYIFDISVLILCVWLDILCVWLNILCVWLNILCVWLNILCVWLDILCVWLNILYVWLNIYLSLQKLRISFLYTPGTRVFSTAQFTIPGFFSVFSFHGAFESSKAKKAELLPVNHHRTP